MTNLVKGNSFTEVYYDLVDLVMNQTQFLSRPRGMMIKECIPVMFQIENPRDRLLYVPERKFSASYMVAEALWYFLGDNRTDWISNYASFWEGISDDGITANSAYGARIFKPHNYIADNAYTQWDYVKDELTKDRDSRRAVIHIRTPSDSIHAKKDVPCTLSLQFFIRDEKLYMVTDMRSSDLILGISYDVPAFTLFQEALANELGVELGTYSHISHSLHVYERHFGMCESILDHRPRQGTLPSESGIISMPPMPKDIPVQVLNDLQWAARKCDDYNSLLELTSSWEVKQINRFWKDWGLVLLMHRAQRLKLDELAETCRKSVSFEGYHAFEK